jgi:rhodanese-related sulfurtransferase
LIDIEGQPAQLLYPQIIAPRQSWFRYNRCYRGACHMAYKIDPKELNEARKEFLILDVREPDELGGDMIEGAFNIPLGQLIRKSRRGGLSDLKERKIVTYSNSGYRGAIAADELNKQGFDAVTIDGGYSAWSDWRNQNKV